MPEGQRIADFPFSVLCQTANDKDFSLVLEMTIRESPRFPVPSHQSLVTSHKIAPIKNPLCKAERVSCKSSLSQCFLQLGTEDARAAVCGMAQASDGEACFGECHLALPADGKERKGAG